HPAAQTELPRLMVHKPAKAHSLDAAANNIASGKHLNYARERYAPSAVSTRIFSPSLIKGGTCTTSPVSVLAGLVTLEAVADFSPRSVSMTVKSTVWGSSMPTALPSKNSNLICRFGNK